MVPKLLRSCFFAVTCFIQLSSLSLAQGPPKSACRPIADVIFLLDGSDSISEQEFSEQLQFVRSFVQLSDISPESIRVGLTVVSSTIGDEFPLSLNSTKENLVQVLNSLNQPQEGSRTDLGLVEMEQLFNRHARRGVLRIGVILTDGRAKYVRATEGEARVIKDAGVFLIAVGVGRLIKFTELEKIASTKRNAYNLEPIAESTKYLADTVNFLGKEACTGHILVNELDMKPPGRASGSSMAKKPVQTLTSKAPSLTTIPAVQIADYSLIDLNTLTGGVSGHNVMGDMLKANSLMQIKNTFDVKMEPFEALKSIKSKIPIPQPAEQLKDVLQTKFAGPNINIQMLGPSNTKMPYVSYKMGDGQRSFTRFTAPHLVNTPSPFSINRTTPSKTTTSAAINIPVINTTPKSPPTTIAVTKSHAKVVQSREQSPTPSETADMIIKSLTASKNTFNDFLLDMGPANGVTPKVKPTIDIFPEITPTRGVGVEFQGPTAAETLAFLKQEITPPRTYEEHMNPIFQMFDVTDPNRNTNLRTKAVTVQPTTTTVSPKEAYKRAEMAAMRDRCSKGRFVDGIAYISKPGTCSEFLQCYKEANDLHVRIARCPFETFFDDVHSVCRHHEQLTCLTDPCVDTTVTSYDHPGSCRAYWHCERRRSRPACCPSGTSYVPGFGCARNATCSDTCMDFGNLNQVIHALCKPELYMDFQGGLVDVSGNNLAMGIYNVELDGGTGAFFGKSHLKLWRFSGMSLGQHVTISFRFRISVTAKKGRLMHIVSNCCYSCGAEPQPSLDIAIIPADQGGVAVFSTTTKEAGEIFLFVPFKDTFTGWNKLEYRYDGQSIRGTVNGQSAQKNIVGNILGRSEPLLIGSCGVSNAYDGFLDEFKFYMCNP
ncbi:uncharacterized protein LOC123533983 isoform X2 [Mercenaria mercenaria]|uniref:uncharacterized protein LOC123533983 isoform X2 n=1 Tax=Mercenaria mercenaria TaxID=6596 RepID=UPI001E1D9075|nr:uncharacterized protein LOC123533983 isoform X2 [Mercenaria mercenaria]